MPTKVGKLSAVHTDIFHCTLCPLHETRTRTVPGAGNPDADIMFIGEAPGYNEDQQGLPFVGRSGDYLEELLEGIGLQREQVFIANVVKCRPPDNRDPFSNEIETCRPYLIDQINIIDPLVIATLGRFSMGMFFTNAKISQIHGQPRYGSRRAYYPLYHPAAALRNGKLRSTMEADFAHLLEVVHKVNARRERGEMSADAEAEPLPTFGDDNSAQQKSLFD